MGIRFKWELAGFYEQWGHTKFQFNLLKIILHIILFRVLYERTERGGLITILYRRHIFLLNVICLDLYMLIWLRFRTCLPQDCWILCKIYQEGLLLLQSIYFMNEFVTVQQSWETKTKCMSSPKIEVFGPRLLKFPRIDHFTVSVTKLLLFLIIRKLIWIEF